MAKLTLKQIYTALETGIYYYGNGGGCEFSQVSDIKIFVPIWHLDPESLICK